MRTRSFACRGFARYENVTLSGLGFYPWQAFPPGVFVPTDPNLTNLVQGFAARFGP
jgi:hypothetical protein